MIEATCSACGTVNRIAEGDVPAGAKFLTCSSCKSRVVLPGAKTGQLPKMPTPPKAAMIPPPPTPRSPALGPNIADLPTPKRQGPLAGLEGSKPAPRSGLDIADLPAPKSARPTGSPLDLDNLLPPNLPAPKGPTGTGIVDLPAPKGPSAKAVVPPVIAKPVPAGIVDLPAPKGPAGITDLPTPKGPPARPAVPAQPQRAAVPPATPREQYPDIVDLPAPKGGIVDLPTPKPSANTDLPAPKGFFDDLPQPASAAKQHKVDLPAPKGFFDDLPQPSKSSTPALPAPKGFFDDLPQPSKATTPALPAPKGFFDDDPPPAPTSTRAPSPSKPPASRGVFDDLPEPASGSSGGSGAHELDLSPSGGSGALDLDPGPSGAAVGPELDLGSPPPSSAKSDFADLDLSTPSAPNQPTVKSGISIKSTSPSARSATTGRSSGDVSALNVLPGKGDIKLDLEDEPSRAAQNAAAIRRGEMPGKKNAAEISAEARARKSKRTKIVLGAVLALAAAGAGGAYVYKRHVAKQQREAELAQHLQSARGAIHGDQPSHWTRAGSEAAAVLEVDDTNIEALGLRAEALIGGALDTGVGGEARIAQGRKIVADALEKNITGPQLDTAQALGMIGANQAERAVTKLEAMTKRDPKNGFWLLYLGWAQVAKNDPTSALKSFDAAIAADPKTKLPALYARGRAKLQLVDLEGAKADFAAILEIAKDHIGAQVGLAAALPPSQSSQREADLLAILARKDIATGDPRAVVQAWTLAGDTARLGGRFDVARERYRQALTLSKLDVDALVGNARVEIRDAKLAVAADLVQKALSQSAESAEANLVAAELYIRQGKVNDAVAITQKLAARVPPLPPLQRANLQLVLGNLLETQGKDEEALAAWAEGAKLAGDLDLAPMMAAVTKLGVLAKKASDNHDDKKAADYHARADQLLSALADRAQDDATLSKTLGAAYLGADDPTKAEHFLRRAVEMRGTDIETHLELAKALVKLNRIDDALEQLRAAQQLDTTRLDIALEIARTLEGSKRDDAALEAYTKLLAAKDPPVQARVHAGRFFARKHDIPHAAEQAEPILKAEPDNAAGHYLRGEGLIVAGKLDDARKELTMAVDGDPDPQYLDAQGRAAEASVIAQSDTKYYELALRAYERASDAAPTMLNPQAGMGRVYLARKEYSKAIPPLIAANKIDAKDPEVMFNLGIAYKGYGQPGAAVDWLVAAARDKQDADTWWQLGQLYQDANRGTETQKALQNATRLGRDKETKTGTKVEWLTEAWYRLGQTEYGLHNWPAAKSAFEAYVGRNPATGTELTEARRLLNGELKAP